MDSSSSHSSTDDSDPEVPDEEFREASASSTQDENRMNSAEELGDLPLSQSLPSVRLPAVAGRRKGKESWVLPDLPPGYMRKMMVHKSGKVEMKLRDTHFKFSPRVMGELPWYAAAWKIDERSEETPGLDSLMDADGGNQSAFSWKKECAEPSLQNEGIPPDEDFYLEDLRKNLPSLSPSPDQNKDSDQDQTKIKPEKELDLMEESEGNYLPIFRLPYSFPFAKQPNAAAAAAKGKEKAEGKYRAREATSNRLKRIEDKSSKKSERNVQEDAGI